MMPSGPPYTGPTGIIMKDGHLHVEGYPTAERLYIRVSGGSEGSGADSEIGCPFFIESFQIFRRLFFALPIIEPINVLPGLIWAALGPSK